MGMTRIPIEHEGTAVEVKHGEGVVSLDLGCPMRP